MILRPLDIQLALIKTFYALAVKSVKYYTGLAFGKNNACLFKEIRLLRAYVDILKEFEIIDTAIPCNCCIEGDYNVLLNSLLPVTNTPIQFGCDNQGYIVYNNIGYNFTYWYDKSNKKIVIDFTGTLNNVIITVNDVVFTDTCDITGNADSPIEVATIDEIEGIPVKVDNQYGTWNGSITVYEPDGTTELVPPLNITIPAADLDNIEVILNQWNTAHPNWILQYFEGNYVLYSPFNNFDYTDYIVKFKQYENGSDSFTSFDVATIASFVTVNTPAHADILFQQPTFVASHVAETSLALPSTPLPYVTTPTFARALIRIPLNQFAVGEPATMSIPLYELFNSSTQDFYYLGMPMFNHIGSYTSMTELINDFNTNSGQGFTASDGGFLPIPEVLATASNASNIFNSAVPGNAYTAKLVNAALPIPIDTNIGAYTVGVGDSTSDIANGIAAAIIAQGTYTGTVNVVGSVITLTAPIGTGDSWNYVAGVSTYAFTIQKPGDRPTSYYFNGGEAPPTVPINVLNITALNVYPQTDYDGGIIEIRYLTEMLTSDSGQFAGAINDTAGVVTYSDDLNGPIYTSTQNFTDVQTMLNIASMLSVPTVLGTLGDSDPLSWPVIVEIQDPSAWRYNGTTFTYEFTPEGSTRSYRSSDEYTLGIDATEATYTLVILNGNDVPFGLPIINTGNFQDYQAIVDDLNLQTAFNVNFIASLNGDNIIIQSVYSLQGSTFNNYSFQLALDYTSQQYAAIDFVTTAEEMSGGIDAVSPNINLYNVFADSYIYTLLENDYDYNGITDFVTQFNIDSPSNYSAEYLGTQQALPEILSQSLLNLFNLPETPNTVVKAYYTYSLFNPALYSLIGTYTPTSSANYTATGLVAGLTTSINANPWTGTATAIASTLKLLSPPSTFGSYNGYYTAITKTIPNINAVAQVQILTGVSVSGSLKLIVSLGSVDLGLQNFPIPQTPVECATAYKARINFGTATHGYSAVSQGPFINIFAPANTGTILNNATISATIATGGVTIKTTPTPTFTGGTDTTTTIVLNSFSGGGLTTYDKVSFIADPAIYTNIYNGTNFIYTNLSASPNYIYPGIFADGSDNTAGQITLELLQASTNTTWTLYQDSTAINYASFQQWATFINSSTSTNRDFSASIFGSNAFRIDSPEDSFAYFNDDYSLFLGYSYASPQWIDNTFGQSSTITNGVAPTLESYEGIFQAGVLGNFINTDPCSPSTVTQTCLTNSQVSKIIQHINKLVR